MREIMFRAKLLTRDRWVYGDYFSQCKDGVTTHCIVEHRYGRERGREVMWEVAAPTVGEFTTIEDKNGTRVFEGDIIEYLADTIEPARVRVRWNPDVLMWDTDDQYRLSLATTMQMRGARVVGNIHDNPELVEALVEAAS